MRSTRIGLVTAAMVLGGFAGACGSKDATGPGISLSLQEVYGLADELGSIIDSYTAASIRSGLGALFRAVPARSVAAAIPFNANANCPGGGTTSVTGSYDGTTTVTADATFGYNSCRTAHYTTSGSFRATGSGTSTPTTATAQATVSGTLTVSTLDGRSGACLIDATVNVSMGQTGNPVTTISGTACGAKVSGTY